MCCGRKTVQNTVKQVGAFTSYVQLKVGPKEIPEATKTMTYTSF